MRAGAAVVAGVAIFLAFGSPLLHFARASDAGGENRTPPGARESIPLHGRIHADGKRIETTVYRSSDELSAHLLRLQGLWDGEAVDLHTQNFPGGAAFSVFDVHRGLQWTYRIEEREGGVEVLRALSPLSPGAPTQRDGLLEQVELPEGLTVLSRISDELEGREAETAILVATSPWPSLAEELGVSTALCDPASVDPTDDREESGDPGDEGATYCGERGPFRLHATVDGSAEDETWVLLQIVRSGETP